jgi:SseB protein N-terminal domain
MTIVTDDNTASPAGERAEVAVERALAVVLNDASGLGDLLDALSRSRLWLPLPDDGRPVTDGSAVDLPTVTHQGCEYVPAFTSAARLRASVPRPRTAVPVVHVPAPVAPHAVVPTGVLAGRLPAGVGIALNPGLGESVAIGPDDVAYLAVAPEARAAGRIEVGPPPVPLDGLLGAIRYGLLGVAAAGQAAAAWLSVRFAGEGLVISVTLDDPKDAGAQDAVIRVLEQAALAAPQHPGFPVDVTFPGEGEPDPVDEWVSACGAPFYRRA